MNTSKDPNDETMRMLLRLRNDHKADGGPSVAHNTTH